MLDGVEGTALGAAALGVLALGREATLDAALASLCDLDAHLGPVEAPTPELLATYRTLRSSVPGLIAGLGRLAPFYEAAPMGASSSVDVAASQNEKPVLSGSDE